MSLTKVTYSMIAGEAINVLDFGAVGDGVANDTAAIQAAHDYSVANGFFHVVFPAGEYNFTTLTWSPYVGAKTTGKVYLQTDNASGRTIQISDQYGRPTQYGVNSQTNPMWCGQFYLINTNGANTAIAWSFGGETNAYYCSLSYMQGIETRGFGGGVYEFRHNAFGLDFIECNDLANNGNHIIVGASATNVITATNFTSCRFGSSTGYAFDIVSTHSNTFSMVSCEFVYLAGFIKPGNSSPLTTINIIGGNFEWSQVTAPYVNNNTGATIVINGATVAPGALSGWPTPVISQTSGISTTTFINIKYVLPGAPPTMPTLHNYVDATSKGVLDYSPNDQNGNGLSALVTFNAGAIVGFNGITQRETAYTPTWSGTLGNGTLVGTYQRIGNQISIWIKLVWGTTTSHGAGSQLFGLPYQSSATSGGGGTWWADDYLTGNKTGTVRVTSSQTSCVLYDDATTVQVSNIAPMTWANQDSIELFFTYFV
jgi:hypothetical protein